ncbi:type II secretion system secretin GspD [Acidovorax sp. NCPPB 3576]|uniref:type II secretion system secretin GspD n=1 Tax=Acidovorax sp. NCPPB 3576 TaxID=2940488 RepID=UPI0023497DA1|nr:type II secretion system secretin GspD [Acidovorax sp. NCPPB 3576]WCM89287.1 type II secretion system secretin GspD [Acidovorax sp. NCPPB 3576]
MTSLTSQRLRFALHSLAAGALLACAGGTLQAQTAVGTGTSSVRAGEPVTLNFANAEIEAVARTMATITGRNVVVDPRVKGQLTLVTERAVTPAAAFQQFLAALRLQGFTVVEAAGLYKVVPEADAKLQAGSVNVSESGLGGTRGGGQIVTQIFKLNFENAANLVPVLRPLISPNNTINVNPGNNSLVITDYADNLQRLARIVAAMDVSNASDVEVIPLQNALATELAPLVSRLLEGSGTAAGAVPAVAQGQSDTSFRTTLLAEPRSNSLILRAANPARLALVRSLVQKLDQPPTPGSSAAGGNIHVVYLKNADATKLAATLRAALSSATGSGSSGSGATSGAPTGSGLGSTGLSGGGMSQTGGGSSMSNNSAFGGSSSSSSGGGLGSNASSLGNSSNSNQPSTGGQIQADPTTNSLIISAPEPQFRQLRAVIDQLDGRRAQVLVESLIVEVAANKVAEFGIQWQSVVGNTGSGTVGVIGTNSTQGGGSNIINLALAAASGNSTSIASALTSSGSSLGNGMNVAIAPRINGNYYLGALANFLENTGDANVLSTPNLMTLDNEEAQIIIGNNVPFVTGSYANSTGSSTVNPFTTVERKDVGLMLRVRPQINENGLVKLTLYQEVSQVNDGTLTAANGPTTSKRSIESTVLVNDGSVIVLGGLLEDRYALGQDKVPLMGDLPLVGGLFRNENRSRKKTNLMVFLRPLVIRDAATSDAVMADRYEAIRALQQNTQPAPSTVMRSVSDAPVLPPLRSDTTAPTTPLVPQAPLRTAPIAPLAPEQRALPRPVTSPSDEYTAPPEKLSPQ